MNKYIWLLVLVTAIASSNSSSSFFYSAGENLLFLVIGIFLSPIWWFISKRKGRPSWLWFDWLNSASYIMIILLVLPNIVERQLPSRGSGIQWAADRENQNQTPATGYRAFQEAQDSDN